MVSVVKIFFISSLSGPILSCMLQGSSWLHGEVLITQVSNTSVPSMISMISITEISMAGLFRLNPPWGPLLNQVSAVLPASEGSFPEKVWEYPVCWIFLLFLLFSRGGEQSQVNQGPDGIFACIRYHLFSLYWNFRYSLIMCLPPSKFGIQEIHLQFLWPFQDQ